MNVIKYLTNWKYRLFCRKISDTRTAIAELEFKIFKARQMREEARKLRDRAIEQLAQIKPRLETANSEAERNPLEADQKAYEEAVGKYEGQMKMIDAEINGTEEGAGLLDHVHGLTELQLMYKDYAKHL